MTEGLPIRRGHDIPQHRPVGRSGDLRLGGRHGQ